MTDQNKRRDELAEAFGDEETEHFQCPYSFKKGYDAAVAELEKENAKFHAEICEHATVGYLMAAEDMNTRIRELEAECERLRVALDSAAYVIHGEFCTEVHHHFCTSARKALEGAERKGE